MSLLEYMSTVKRHLLSQKLPGTYRSDSNRNFLFVFFIIGLLNLILGVIATFVYSSLMETTIPYTDDLSTDVYLPSGKIYLFLEMREFYQTNLRYSKSISYDQLRGERPKSLNAASPLSYEDGKAIYPAGLLPNSFPHDEYEIDGVEIETDGISWESERNIVRPPSYTRDEVVAPPLWPNYTEVPDLSLNERFTNWIYIAPFPSFRKLWGVIDVATEGTYTLNITSRFPYGDKRVSLIQSSVIGSKNYFLSIGLILVGLSMILLSLHYHCE
ncbi:CDC50-LIKE PROTEIN [Encephalitozoon cuniculi GB-M1]|uniref:CDC50-LIKE PROTEIN n=2 Tax=Encephalitozoon cuniculi TaxID=6035 RepID=Q8SRN1_ENCCU|nr:Cdc50-like protein [Encephalitozoon cuniculi GB-M1]AGE95718.1 CDC50-like protein [Encephalitozoon cuniculi]KMV66042.1 Cdc50-like protein [Encephalitozoon cuniculi EcunIII-L]UYI27742.1 cell division control protein Cdc50 [Encephalitozoon cuniculi]CAD25506.1 CDC50-LIKE PROTEIN [Encephalitozoon cuniculi GB-M1]